MVKKVVEFQVNVHETDDGLWAEVVDMPGCFATGDNEDELREALTEAITLWTMVGDRVTMVGELEWRDPPSSAHAEVVERTLVSS